MIVPDPKSEGTGRNAADDLASSTRAGLRRGSRPAIPGELRSRALGGAFLSCHGCGTSLAEGGPYQLQKVIQGTETLGELALCLRCGRRILNELSTDSMSSMRAFFDAHYHVSVDLWHCHFCGRTRRARKPHTLVALCEKAHLLHPVIVLCGCCGEDLQASISQKSSEALADFIRRTFPGVPDGLEVLPFDGGRI